MQSSKYFFIIFFICSTVTAQQSTFSLSQQNNQPLSNDVSHMEIAGDTLWTGTGKGINRTINQGLTWESFADRKFINPSVAAITVRDSLIWASTLYTKQSGDNGSVQTGSGYSVSFDRGATWISIPQTVDSSRDSIISYGVNTALSILPVIVPEQNVTWGISLSKSKVWIASWASSLRFSSDNGKTWTRVLLPPDDRHSIKPIDTLPGYINRTDGISRYFDPRYNNNMLAFSVYAIDDDTVWCGTAGGMNKSTDGGTSWTRITSQPTSFSGNWIITIRPQIVGNVRRIWTTNWPTDQTESYGISYTADNGNTWKNFLTGVKAYDFAFQDNIIYVATETGLYRSTDDGLTWMHSGTISDAGTHQIITSDPIYAVRTIGSRLWLATNDGIVSTVDTAIVFGSKWDFNRTFEYIGNAKYVYAYPNPFSPNSGIIRIHYSTAGRETEVTIEIFDFAMNRVRTIIRNAQRHGTQDYDEIWDGHDDKGRRVANGVYHYRVTVGNDVPMWGKIMVLQ